MSPALVLLICGLSTVRESAMGANAASTNHKHRKTCGGTQEYDIREAVCCENRLHSGEGRSCCGEQAFNPAKGTCCKVQHGCNIKANVTHGLSEEVSVCCGLTAYNPLNELCCQSTVLPRPAPNAQCCGHKAFDQDKEICCSPSDNKLILLRHTSDHECCGHRQYNIKTECCRWTNELSEIFPINSPRCKEQSALNRPTTYNPHSQPTIVGKPAPNAQYCGKKAFDQDKEICCGPFDNKLILLRHTSDHECCGHRQYNIKTECCRWTNELSEIFPINSPRCKEQSGLHQQKHRPQPNCTEPPTSLCGSSLYNPKEFRCCERNQTKSHWCCAPGHCNAAPTVYNPHTHVCCDGCVSERKPWIDQCCGETAYGLAQRGVLCCNNTLYKNRTDGEECSDSDIPYNPAKGTICQSQFHASPGQHCCGKDVYQPHSEICCNGHRHPKGENTQCCGVQAYSIKDPHVKCCAGTLYYLTSFDRLGHEAKCCGSLLQNLDVCCSSGDKAVLYSAKEQFRCCGHFYYNTSLWSCCAERLSPAHKQQHQHKEMKESRLLSLNNLSENDLCEELQIGTVESISVHSVAFRNALKIHGRNATIEHLSSPYILKTPDHCAFPKLIPGKTYIFDQVHVFTDFSHDSFLQSLHFIFDKCSHY